MTGGFPILATRDQPRLESFYRDAFGAERTYAFDPGGFVVHLGIEAE